MDISVIKNLGKWMKVRVNIENAQNNQKLSCAFKLVRMEVVRRNVVTLIAKIEKL